MGQKVLYDNKAKDIFTDAMQAAVLLQEKGIVDSAAYLWNICKVVKGADTLIIKMAQYVADTDK